MSELDMSVYAKISAKLYLNDKVQALAEATPSAFVLWINAITYAVDCLTDGFVSDFALRRFLSARNEDIESLVVANLFEYVQGGVRIHDFSQSQRTKGDVESLKAKRSAAGRKGMANRWGNESGSDNKNNKQITSVITSVTKSVIKNGDTEDAIQRSETDTVLGLSHHENQHSVGKQRAEQITKPITNTQNTTDPVEGENVDITTVCDNKNNKPITSVITNEYQTDNKAITDTDTDTDTDTVIKTPLIPQLPTDFQEKRELLEKVFDQIRSIYPTNKYDGDKSTTRFDLEMNYPRIARAAVKAGYENPFEFLIARVKAYLAATKPRYVKKLSRFIVQEEYTTDWEPEKPEMSKAEARFAANLSLGAAFAQAEPTVSEFAQIGAA